MNVATHMNHKCFLTIVDDFTRRTWIFLMKHKSEARLLLQHFITFVEVQFHTAVQCVRSHNGPEFHIPAYYADKGIVQQTSCVATPQ